jgi:hypothetical protein
MEKKMKRILLTLLVLFASNIHAQTCLFRAKDVVHPELTVAPFLQDDLNRPLYIDSAVVTSDCTDEACVISKDDLFLLSRRGGDLILTWVKESNKVTRMDVRLETHSVKKQSIQFLKSASSNGYTFYLLKNGQKPCEEFPRWSAVALYAKKMCSIYTVEAFQTNPDQAMQAKYIEPDDPTAELKPGACTGTRQPSTGTGGEPPK